MAAVVVDSCFRYMEGQFYQMEYAPYSTLHQISPQPTSSLIASRLVVAPQDDRREQLDRLERALSVEFSPGQEDSFFDMLTGQSHAFDSALSAYRTFRRSQSTTAASSVQLAGPGMPTPEVLSYPHVVAHSPKGVCMSSYKSEPALADGPGAEVSKLSPRGKKSASLTELPRNIPLFSPFGSGIPQPNGYSATRLSSSRSSDGEQVLADSLSAEQSEGASWMALSPSQIMVDPTPSDTSQMSKTAAPVNTAASPFPEISATRNQPDTQTDMSVVSTLVQIRVSADLEISAILSQPNSEAGVSAASAPSAPGDPPPSTGHVDDDSGPSHLNLQLSLKHQMEAAPVSPMGKGRAGSMPRGTKVTRPIPRFLAFPKRPLLPETGAGLEAAEAPKGARSVPGRGFHSSDGLSVQELRCLDAHQLAEGRDTSGAGRGSGREGCSGCSLTALALALSLAIPCGGGSSPEDQGNDVAAEQRLAGDAGGDAPSGTLRVW